MARTTRFTVRGFKVTSASQRRFVVVSVREQDRVTDDGVFVKFAHIEKRSDNLTTARTYARRLHQNSIGRDIAFVVVDTTTGEEV